MSPPGTGVEVGAGADGWVEGNAPAGAAGAGVWGVGCGVDAAVLLSP